MDDKKRTSTSLTAEEYVFPCDKNENVEDRKKIKDLTTLLNSYTKHDALDDVSDFLASSYKSFLINCIYVELKCTTSRELNTLISICLDIIKNNHEIFKYQNIYFISLNTLFFLLNKVDNVNNYLEYLSFRIFYNLLFADNWTKDNHIEVFAKLNYINFFIISKIFKKYVIDPNNDSDIPPTSRINKIINHVSVEFLSYEKENHYTVNKSGVIENTENIRLNKNFSLCHDYCDHLNSVNVERASSLSRNKYIFQNLQDTSILVPINLKNREIFVNYHNDKILWHKRRKIVIYEHTLEEKKKTSNEQHNGDSNVTLVNSNDELVLKIYQTIIHLVIKFDLTIYIICECINVLLNLCEKCNQELILYDFLLLYKFFLKSDQKKKSQRFITFMIQLITKCRKEIQKQLFFKLIKGFNSFLNLLYVDNSDIRMQAKGCLLSLDIFYEHLNNSTTGQKQHLHSSSTHIRGHHMAICVNNEISRIMNLILFHLNYIHDVSNNQYADKVTKEAEYDNFFKIRASKDFLLKSYINKQISIKKDKLFCKDKNETNKNIIITNNIVEMEILMKTFDCIFSLVPDRTSYNVCFIFFFISTLMSIKKICKNKQFEFPKKFFFFIKHLFIQTIYVLESIDRMEDQTMNSKNITAIVEYFSIENETSYNKNSNITLFEERDVKQIIERIKLSSRVRSDKPFILLLEEMYSRVITFLMPNEKKWTFLNSSNFYFFKKVLLRISHFYHKKNGSKNMMKLFFLKSIFKNIKKKTKWKLNFKKVHGEEENITLQNMQLGYKKYAKLFCEKPKYISSEMASYFSFCLDFLKTFVLFDKSLSYHLKGSKYKSLIINICKTTIFKYNFFLPAKSTTNCFFHSIIVLRNVYLNIYKSGKGNKLLHEICVTIFLCCNKALNSIKRDDVIFHNNNKLGCLKKHYKMKQSSYSIFSDTIKTQSKGKTCPIIITNKFEKSFKEYYLNNSLPIFIKCLDVMTDIVKLNLLRHKVSSTRVIIKKSKIEKRKKKRLKNLKSEKNLILFTHRCMSNLCKYLIKKTKEDFFYSARKYILNFIQNFIALNTILTLKYKIRNNLNVEQILSFCFYNIYTDHDISTFSIIHYIAFCLKNYINLCGTKIKKSNHYLDVCDDLIFQIVDEYYSYDFPKTNLWEEYVSKTVSFNSLKNTSVDCPGE
ncbi:hypothetical protein, conserved [Plasmodium gonderi]|uniref:Uncharacterized protein n=1 Tax=Plasmodium gonderi TaxID=77519 RepID=A0A1Y1JE35_PLAGO|nr:hypothetical protein, conserved [Plasmodium gonderi]GAW80520.1 hypothetical protein, conserved [Plasmodium gonderi]